MTFEQQWIEYDYNPFVLFDANSKVLSLNAEAQFLLGAVTTKELFEVAKTYASVSFGFKTTFVDLEFGRYKFFGLTVGYENEEQLGIKLYQTPSFKLSTPKPHGDLTNIFTIIDLCISTHSISSNIEFNKIYDPTIPDVVVDSNALIKLLNKIYDCFLENSSIHTKVFYRIGEHIRFEDKKYSLFSIVISAAHLSKESTSQLKVIAENNDFFMDISENCVTVNIPMTTSI